MKLKAVVIDDEKPIRDTLKGVLEDEGYAVSLAEEGVAGVRLVRETIPDVVLLDIWMPGIDGIAVLEKLKDELPQIPVIIMSGHGTVETAVKATKIGAFDFIEKPISLDRLLLLMNNAIKYYSLLNENIYLKEKLMKDSEIVAKSAKMQKILDEIKSLSKTNMSIILIGEDGTGKTFLAKYIHSLSDRKNTKFVELNCASEGMNSARVLNEKIALARDGSLYLKDFLHMETDAQNLILRNSGDLRLILSSSRDFRKDLDKGTLLSAFFYGINGVSIYVPPLRERKEDIRAIIETFSRQIARHNLKPLKFTDKALEIIEMNDWRGNIKELKNFVEHMMITSRGRVISHRDLPDYVTRNCDVSQLEENLFRHNLISQAKKAFEKEFIRMKLTEAGGNMKKTAEILGLKEGHLVRKVEHYKLKDYVR